MERFLALDIVLDGKNERLGLIGGGTILLGRDPGEGGIAVPANAVSRQHGAIDFIDGDYFYRDLGSTNGSWLNGRKLSKSKRTAIRPGDQLQLADGLLQVYYADQMGSALSGSRAYDRGGRTLFIFGRDGLVDKRPVGDYGRALTLGGSQSDIELEGDLFEEASLIIEKQGEDICFFSVTKEVPIVLNDQEVDLDAVGKIVDGDELRISSYGIVFSDPYGDGYSIPEEFAKNEIDREGIDPARATQEIKASARKPINPLFSTVTSEDAFAERSKASGTNLAGTEELYNSRTLKRSRGRTAEPDENELGSEEKSMIGLGIMMLLLIGGVAAWWFLT